MTEIAFIDGPLDGTTTEVSEPWPRESYLHETDEGEVFTYLRDSSDSSEPYDFQLYEVTDAPDADDADEVYEATEVHDPKGLEGEQGIVGEIGPPGVDGVDGENLGHWLTPSYLAYIGSGPGAGYDWDTRAIIGFDEWGWPLDKIPARTYSGYTEEPGHEHIFTQFDEDQLARERAATGTPSEGEEIPGLPNGWISPSRAGRHYHKGWQPIDGLITERSRGCEPQRSSDVGGFTLTYLGPLNPRYTHTTWHVSTYWWARGNGPFVELVGYGVIEDDPYEFFTRGSINRNPEYPPDWEVIPGRESSANDFGPYTGRLTWKRMFKMPDFYLPAHDVMWPFSAYNYNLLSYDARNFTEGWMKMDDDGWVYLVDYGPTYPPVYDIFPFSFYIQYESAWRPKVITYG